VAIKKSEIYSSIWRSCDELRGGMDASQYKDYVLVLLFVKYVSDRYAGRKTAMLEVPKGGGFADMVALKGDKEIGDKMNKIISKLAEANGLKGIIDQTDFNDPDKLGKGQDMVDRLSNLVAIFNTPALDFRGNRADGDDLLGDAYEYLMRNFATESGKSKGQFYTPAEVSRIMARVIGISGARDANQAIYDPTCGSGSLLLKAHDEARARTGFDLALYGQEMDNATAALAKMNMFLHDCPTAIIERGNSLSSPLFTNGDGSLKTFDFVVANPPFSTKAWSNGLNPTEDLYKRFVYGTPPAKNGDYAFLLHILKSLRSTGKGAVILPHGVLFRGNAEGGIRKEVVRRGYIKGIIGLPPNLFYGTGIPACIIVLDKEHASARKGIFMIDASRGFLKDGNKNRLREQDIHKIVDAFTRFAEIPKYSRMVPFAEIETNDFNLNIPRYIDSTEPEDLQDIEAHLRGGIPDRDIDDLSRYWKVFPGVRAALFSAGETADARPGYSYLIVKPEDIKSTIFGHAEFQGFRRSVMDLFSDWREANSARLKGIRIHDKPKALIEALSEDLLKMFERAPLLDAYDVYQHLMTYWAESMQDDVYMIVSDGWKQAAMPRLIVEDKHKKTKERPDFTVGKRKFKAELIPPTLIIDAYFEADKWEIERLESEAAALTQTLEELKEEHSGDEGLFAEVLDAKGNISKGDIAARLKAIRDDPEAADERDLLQQYFDLLQRESDAYRKTSEARAKLEADVARKYGELTEKDIQTLVVDDKWLAKLACDVRGEMDAASQSLSNRVRTLADRYTSPLPQLTAEVEALTEVMSEHLKRMRVTLS
jgi:type I restriction enzyme M protein